MGKVKVIIIEHVTQDTGGKIQRGAKCCVPWGADGKEAMSCLESEIEIMVTEYPDEMILLTTEEIDEEEMEAAGEFQGW